MPKITLPDNSVRKFDKPISVNELAEEIGAGLAKATVAGKINGDMLVHERLEVNSTANLNGEVHVPSGQLLIQEGAYMEGQCITSKDKHATKQLTP